MIVVDDIADWVQRTARAGALFSEVRAPFAPESADGATDEIALGDAVIAVRDDGAAVAPTSAPRPFLHPVRTPGGVVVTDAHPADHDWHLGVSVAIQHAGGVNFWGGPTYTRDGGYRWMNDHGRIATSSFARTDDGFVATTDWLGPNGTVVLRESTAWAFATASDSAWSFRTTTTLTAASGPIELGSPGSHGRVGGGYGGFAWRFPAASDVDVRTAEASGEDAVHGSVSDWIAFGARFPDGEATVALASDEKRPWFVRVTDYPGIGSALAWDQPVVLDAGEIRRPVLPRPRRRRTTDGCRGGGASGVTRPTRRTAGRPAGPDRRRRSSASARRP